MEKCRLTQSLTNGHVPSFRCKDEGVYEKYWDLKLFQLKHEKDIFGQIYDMDLA